MLVRLMVAVLMVTGPMPVRICTCATAGTPKAPAGRAAQKSLPGPSKNCGCGHRTPAVSETVPTAGAGASHDQTAGDPTHSNRHDRDCPAVNPRPVASAAVPTPNVASPADPGVGVPVWVESSGAARPSALPRTHHGSVGHAVPLYLSLLSIRI